MENGQLNEWGDALIQKIKNERTQFRKEPLEFSIFYSPLKVKPKLMIIGDNPGGQMDQIGLYTIPEKHEYTDETQDYRIAKMMREKIMKGDKLQEVLKESVKTNRIFFRTPDLNKLSSLENKTKIIDYCRGILYEIIRTIQPQNILAESFGAFRSLSSTETSILVKPNSTKSLLLYGEYAGTPVFGINHPSRASYHKITDEDWGLVNKELEKRL
jgi:hypothetical protein